VLCLLCRHAYALSLAIAGQNYQHQLELIFKVVGSPSDNYIKMTSPIIGDFLRGKPLLSILYRCVCLLSCMDI